MGTWIVIALAYSTLPCAVLAVVWTARRISRDGQQEVCANCGYLRLGLAADSACPECAGHSWAKKFERSRWLVPIQRLAVASLAPAVTAVVGASLALAMRPLVDVGWVVVLAVAPYVVVFLAVLVIHRPTALRRTLWFCGVLAGACNLLLTVVASSYWSSPVQGDDMGWPITDIALLSVAYLVVFLVACASWATMSGFKWGFLINRV